MGDGWESRLTSARPEPQLAEEGFSEGAEPDEVAKKGPEVCIVLKVPRLHAGLVYQADTGFIGEVGENMKAEERGIRLVYSWSFPAILDVPIPRIPAIWIGPAKALLICEMNIG